MMSLENRENMYDTDEFYHLEKIFVGLIIAAAILIGVVFGFWLNQVINESIIRKLFGAFIVLLAFFQLYSVYKQKKQKKTFSW